MLNLVIVAYCQGISAVANSTTDLTYILNVLRGARSGW